MEDFEHIARLVRKAAKKKIIFKYHAATQMARPDRLITTDEVRESLIAEKSLRTIQKIKEDTVA